MWEGLNKTTAEPHQCSATLDLISMMAPNACFDVTGSLQLRHSEGGVVTAGVGLLWTAGSESDLLKPARSVQLHPLVGFALPPLLLLDLCLGLEAIRFMESVMVSLW